MARGLATAVPLKIVYHPAYSAPMLSQGHRFPMQVFRTIHDCLIQDGLVHPSQIVTPPAVATEEQLQRVHTPSYLSAFLSGSLDATRMRKIGFGDVTRQPGLIERTLAECAGTLLTAELALEHGIACNTAGGTHHAHRDFGSGFCILNDLAMTAKELLEMGKAKRVMIVDLDVQ